MTFPSTILPQTNEPQEIQKGMLDLLDKINQTLSLVSSSGFATTAQLTSGLAVKSPLPQTAAGVGQVVIVGPVNGVANLNFPAGGTWVVLQFMNALTATNVVYWTTETNLYGAGGTLIYAVLAASTAWARVWRIA